MQTYGSYLAVFIKDACVLVVVAYLLARGRMLGLLFRERLSAREVVLLGVGLGLAGLSEELFPEAGFQYATNTLFITFANSIGGLPVGLITAAVVSLGVVLQQPHRVLILIPAIVVSALFSRSIRCAGTIPLRLFRGFLAGALAQASRLLLRDLLGPLWNSHPLSLTSLLSIPANGLGIALLLLVVSDAQVRANSEQRRIEVEQQRREAARAHALASEAQLAALRARVHPHFLFNALNSIAELCCIAPERAETAILSLGQLMRQALETSATATIPLRQELTLTQAYIQIEQERLGERLQVVWQMPEGERGTATAIVPFAIQVLAENAIHHGIGNKAGPGKVTITVRPQRRYTLVAVRDDGAGMPPEARRHVLDPEGAATHGLQILAQQLVLHFGESARLRLFCAENRGTLAVFAIPAAGGSL